MSPHRQRIVVELSILASFSAGDHVKHATFGEGQVVIVQFKLDGKKRLRAKMARLERV